MSQGTTVSYGTTCHTKLSLACCFIEKFLYTCLCGKQVLGAGEHKPTEAKRLAQEDEDRKKQEEDARRREEEARLANTAEEKRKRKLEEEATAETPAADLSLAVEASHADDSSLEQSLDALGSDRLDSAAAEQTPLASTELPAAKPNSSSSSSSSSSSGASTNHFDGVSRLNAAEGGQIPPVVVDGPDPGKQPFDTRSGRTGGQGDSGAGEAEGK